jgi:hypothetical protein
VERRIYAAEGVPEETSPAPVVGASYFWGMRFQQKSFNLFPNLRIDL